VGNIAHEDDGGGRRFCHDWCALQRTRFLENSLFHGCWVSCFLSLWEEAGSWDVHIFSMRAGPFRSPVFCEQSRQWLVPYLIVFHRSPFLLRALRLDARNYDPHGSQRSKPTAPLRCDVFVGCGRFVSSFGSPLNRLRYWFAQTKDTDENSDHWATAPGFCAADWVLIRQPLWMEWNCSECTLARCAIYSCIGIIFARHVTLACNHVGGRALNQPMRSRDDVLWRHYLRGSKWYVGRTAYVIHDDFSIARAFQTCCMNIMTMSSVAPLAFYFTVLYAYVTFVNTSSSGR